MSAFNLFIDTDRPSLANPYAEHRPSMDREQHNRRRSVASLLRIVALMLEQGRDTEPIRDHNGNRVGHYTLME